MFPVLIDLGSHEIPFLGETHLFLPTYGFLFALAVLIAWWWFMHRARALELPEETLFNLTFFSLLGGILGAKALLILVEWRVYLENPRLVLGTIRAAGVLIGGVVAATLVFVGYARRHGLPVMRLGDAIVAPLALAQAIGRLGCFSAGCCWGVPAGQGSSLAVTFADPRGNLPAHLLGVPLVPTQLLEMGFDLVLTLVLTWLWRRRPRRAGTVVWFYVLLYGTGRAVIEFWRGDDFRGVYLDGAISTSQVLSLGAILLALTMLLRGRLRSPESASP